ncbi:MAG: ABC transporter ATP-binding protein [Actinobacteria bacterium]|nr:ABC transporter ATP-binding protein [Actinomycetota bacterium]
MDTAIRVHGLRRSFGDVQAVAGVDLEVGHGEIFAFLGPNGAGKTTTIEILEGFGQRDAGEVEVLGVDPAHAGSDWRQRVGIVMQESAGELELTVRECMELYAGLYRRPRDVDETLALVGLDDEAAAKNSGEVSGGQRRRLDVALALIGDPELIFLDEPTTGFDPAARRDAWKMLDGLRDLGKTIFLTTHYMEEAERLADRIAVIAGGRIIDEGTPATIGHRDLAASEIIFLLPQGVGKGELPSDLVALMQSERRDGRIELHSAAPLADLGRLGSWADGRGIEISELEVRRPTLEDVYLRLTAEAAGVAEEAS